MMTDFIPKTSLWRYMQLTANQPEVSAAVTCLHLAALQFLGRYSRHHLLLIVPSIFEVLQYVVSKVT
jgi:hypothetical protein